MTSIRISVDASQVPEAERAKQLKLAVRSGAQTTSEVVSVASVLLRPKSSSTVKARSPSRSGRKAATRPGCSPAVRRPSPPVRRLSVGGQPIRSTRS